MLLKLYAVFDKLAIRKVVAGAMVNEKQTTLVFQEI